MQDFTLSNGQILRKGNYLTIAAYSIHHDSEHYPNPDVFDGFRFANSETDGQNQLVCSCSQPHCLR